MQQLSVERYEFSTDCGDSNEVSFSPSSEKIVSKSGKSNNFKMLFEFFFSPL